MKPIITFQVTAILKSQIKHKLNHKFYHLKKRNISNMKQKEEIAQKRKHNNRFKVNYKEAKIDRS